MDEGDEAYRAQTERITDFLMSGFAKVFLLALLIGAGFLWDVVYNWLKGL
jgi:hypothetical protein